MSDWAPGDLALCVRGGFIAGVRLAHTYPVVGRAYKVAAVEFIDHWNMNFLTLPDAPAQASGRRRWGEVRFIKLRPHEPDAEDAETIRLLNSEPILTETGRAPTPWGTPSASDSRSDRALLAPVGAATLSNNLLHASEIADG